VPSDRTLVVNADDFGQSPGVNRGVLRAHEHGVVTSASLMVCWPSSAAAADSARAYPRLSAGLHVDLGEWTLEDGAWIPRYQRVQPDDGHAVAAEVDRQIEAFRRLVGTDPTHLDSHQHVHLHEPARGILLRAARDLGIPLRRITPAVAYCGDFYGQMDDGSPIPGALTVERMIAILEGLPPGITELACHPGEGDDIDGTYRVERKEELRVLCDPRVRAAISSLGIELYSFGELPKQLHTI